MTTNNYVTVPLENRPGALAEVCQLLGKEKINIEAIDTDSHGEFGFARLMTGDNAKAERVLRKGGYPVTITECIEVTLPNRPGELGRICQSLADAEINLDGVFGSNPTAGSGGTGASRLYLRVNNVAEARRIVEQAIARSSVAR